jgi:hypothetical protein
LNVLKIETSKGKIMNTSTEVDKVKKEFAKEITELETKAFAAGRASATGMPPGAAKAERLAARALVLQAATPGLSNIEAIRLAYAEDGEKIA